MGLSILPLPSVGTHGKTLRAALASMEPLDGKCFNRIKNRIYQNFDICGSCPPNSGRAVNFNIRIGAPERFYSGENIALEDIFGEIRLRVFYIVKPTKDLDILVTDQQLLGQGARKLLEERNVIS